MWRCRCPTGAGASRRRACRTCFASSPGGGPGSRAATPAWAWPSARGSWRPTGAASGRDSDGPPGLGARFTFTLPTVESAGRGPGVESPPVSGGAAQGAPRGSAERVRVLVVDDDPRKLRYVRDVLVQSGYAPLVTGDPEEAVRLME